METKTSYGQTILKEYMLEIVRTTPVENYRPDWLYGMELATAEGYAHGKCLGEIVIDATASAWSLNSLLFMRVEHFAFFDGAQIPFDNRTPFDACPQFSHNLGAAKGI